jgi:hypothetical protein
LNKFKGGNFEKLTLWGVIFQSVSFLLFLPYLFIRDFSKAFIFCIRLVIFILQNLGLDLSIVPLVGKVSKELPEGFESTGITIVIAAYNLANMLNQEFSSYLLDRFDCRDGYYERSKAPYLLNIAFLVGLIAVSPLFLTCRDSRNLKKRQFFQKLT